MLATTIAEGDEYLELLARATRASLEAEPEAERARRELLTSRLGIVRLPPLCGTPR